MLGRIGFDDSSFYSALGGGLIDMLKSDPKEKYAFYALITLATIVSFDFMAHPKGFISKPAKASLVSAMKQEIDFIVSRFSVSSSSTVKSAAKDVDIVFNVMGMK